MDYNEFMRLKGLMTLVGMRPPIPEGVLRLLNEKADEVMKDMILKEGEPFPDIIITVELP